MFDIHKWEPMEIYLVGAGFLKIGVSGDEPDSAEGDAADRRNRKARVAVCRLAQKEERDHLC